MSLIELIMTAVLLGVSMSAIGELVLLNTIASTRLTNSVDGQTGCSRALRRISEDIRAAQSIDSKSDGQTLILYLPVYTSVPQDLIAGFPKFSQPDQITYNVVPDTANVGTYDVTILRTTSDLTDGRPTINPPETVLTGIIGPPGLQAVNGPPSVFSYLTPQPPPKQNYGPVPPAATAPGQQTSFVGVYINLQVQTPPSGLGTNVRIVGTHLEAYLKSATALGSGVQ